VVVVVVVVVVVGGVQLTIELYIVLRQNMWNITSTPFCL